MWASWYSDRKCRNEWQIEIALLELFNGFSSLRVNSILSQETVFHYFEEVEKHIKWYRQHPLSAIPMCYFVGGSTRNISVSTHKLLNPLRENYIYYSNLPNLCLWNIFKASPSEESILKWSLPWFSNYQPCLNIEEIMNNKHVFPVINFSQSVGPSMLIVGFPHNGIRFSFFIELSEF